MTTPTDALVRRSQSDEFLSKSPLMRGAQRGPLPRTRTLSRPYEIAWLTPSGEVNFDTIIAPAVPVIESACANLARGALIATSEGDIAVEDLVPGTLVQTAEHGLLPLQWVGSFTMSPQETHSSDRARLFRVTADSFGLNKPTQDLLLAPRAHILMRHAACQALFGVDQAFGPVRAFEDGETVISVTPMSPVTVFNLAFTQQATIRANGVELESFHPGPHAETLLDDEMLYSLLRLFPNAMTLDTFGPQLIDRLTTFEVRTLRGDG